MELCQHFLILERRSIATIHLEEVGGGVDVGFGVLVALGNDPPIRVNAFEDDAYRWHSSFSFHFYGGMAKSHTTVVPSSMTYALYHTSLTLLSCISGRGFPHKYLSKSNLIFGADLAQDVFQRLDQRVQTRISRKR